MRPSEANGTTDSPLASLRALIAGLAAYVLIGGAVTLAGWALDIRALTDWNGDGISMYPNAAIAAIVCAIALLLATKGGRGRRLVDAGVRITAGFAATIGGLTLLQHLFGVDFGIDTLVAYRPWEILATASPMRMGPPASISFVILGLGLYLTTCGSRGRRLASASAMAVIVIASLSLVGYWFGADQLFGVAAVTGIAWQTSTMIAALGLGLLVAVPEQGLVELVRRPDPGGAVARRLLLPIVVIPLVLFWLRVLGEEVGLYDAAFGVAAVALTMVASLVAVLWATASGISRQHRIASAAERAVRASEARLSAVLHQLPIGVGVMDLNGSWTLNNPIMAHYVPMAIPSALPEQAKRWRAYDADGRPIPIDNWPGRRALRGEIVSPGLEMVHTADDGREVWLRVSAAPLRNELGQVIGATAVVQDMDEIKRAELALREADRRKDDFLATLAHELRNPLAAIHSAVGVLMASDGSTSRLDEMTAIIERQSKQLVRLIDDLLDVARITRGQIELRRERVELQAVIEQALDMVRPMCERKGVRLLVSLPTEAMVLNADSVRLAQIVGNVLNNACKFTARGGDIRLAAERDGEQAVIRVRDTGAGISVRDLPHIFQTFWQPRDAALRRSGSGLGIGLSLAKTLVELHGGEIEAHSEGPGRGSCFIVRVPMAQTAQPADPQLETARPGTAPGAQAVHRVLVVDDHRDGLNAVASLLRLAGYEVHCAATGEEGLDAARRIQPDAILLDIGLPGMDGYEVARRIRSAPWGKHVLLVAMTGWGQDNDKRLAAEAGFDAHVTKPASRDVLERLFQSAAAETGVVAGFG